MIIIFHFSGTRNYKNTQYTFILKFDVLSQTLLHNCNHQNLEPPAATDLEVPTNVTPTKKLTFSEFIWVWGFSQNSAKTAEDISV